MHKIVNGIQVELTSEEEAIILAEWAANEIKAAEELAALPAKLRALAIEFFNAEGHQYLRAIVLVLLDEINDLRGWIRNFKIEVAAANNLTNLQTRVASLPDMPNRTATQAKNVLETKINDGLAD